MKNIYKTFLFIVLISIVLLVVVTYESINFKNSPLSNEIQIKLKKKEYYLRKLALQKYNINTSFPIIISDKLKDNMFGLATYNNGSIKIILNKNRFQESDEYMIDYVLPHEYAHAIMFLFNDFTKRNSGHSKRWQNICLNLEGKKCDRFVNDQDILMGKLDFIY